MKNKLQIMRAMPPVTDDEIRSHMDFDAIIREHHLQLAHRANSLRGFKIILATAVLAGTAYLLLRTENPPSTLPEPEKIAPSETRPETEPLIQKESRVEPKKKITIPKKETNVQAEQTYVRAEPTAGYDRLYAYFSKELKYPKAAIKDSVQGTALISFIIDEQGDLAKVTIDNSLGPLFDEECFRLISNMPKWNPALLNGVPTLARISLPLTFRLSVPPKNGSSVGGKKNRSDQTYVRAEPKAGYENLYNYFSNELTYPKEAVKDSVQGTAVISFTIDEVGKPVKVEVENSLGPLFDEECLRLIAQMPEWNAALLNGAPVPTRISLPLTFRIKAKAQTGK